MSDSTWANKLFFGDNLNILRDHVVGESVDLVYLDPPFNSNATYNVLYAERDGSKSAAQITAFEDTWAWGMEAAAAYDDLMTGAEAPRKLRDLMGALRGFLGSSDMVAYLVMMAPRLVELHRALKPTGSLYLHCDPTASHYLKLLLDAIFGPDNFRSEIIWKRTSGHSDARRFGPVHDTILFYSKSGGLTWNQQYQSYESSYVETYYRYQDSDGRRWMSDNLSAAGLTGGGYEYEWRGVRRVWRCPHSTMERYEAEGRLFYTKNGIPRLKRYLDESKGLPAQDVWTDLEALRSWHRERLGYPTQKPESLLERIIRASSNEGDTVLDPFCGCGTAIAVAERLHRRWIGIDITHLAITLIKNRLVDTFGADLSPYAIIGEPEDEAGARALAAQNRHQFEWWALSLIGARPAQDKKKGADGGVDGFVYFFDDTSGKPKKIVVQVKSGKVQRNQIGDLLGVMGIQGAEIAIFVTLDPPTAPMLRDATAAGFYEPEHYPGRRFPRVQILTIAELLGGRGAEYPRMAPATFKRAARRPKGLEDAQGELRWSVSQDAASAG